MVGSGVVTVVLQAQDMIKHVYMPEIMYPGLKWLYATLPGLVASHVVHDIVYCKQCTVNSVYLHNVACTRLEAIVQTADESIHLPVTLAQLMRPDIGRNMSCTVGDFV